MLEERRHEGLIGSTCAKYTEHEDCLKKRNAPFNSSDLRWNTSMHKTYNRVSINTRHEDCVPRDAH